MNSTVIKTSGTPEFGVTGVEVHNSWGQDVSDREFDRVFAGMVSSATFHAWSFRAYGNSDPTC